MRNLLLGALAVAALALTGCDRHSPDDGHGHEAPADEHEGHAHGDPDEHEDEV